MAMATSTNARQNGQQRPASTNRLTNPRPVVTTQPAIHTLTTSPDYVPVSLPSSVLMSPRPRWPSWLAPVIIVLGVLFISVLVLALAIALRPPAVTPVVTPEDKVIASPEGKLPPGDPDTNFAPSKVETKKAEEKAALEKPAQAEPQEAQPKKKVVKSKRYRKRSARLRRRLRRRRRRRAKRRRRRRRRITTRSRSAYKPYRKLRHDELDAILSSASK
jgi:hypothetical protein